MIFLAHKRGQSRLRFCDLARCITPQDPQNLSLSKGILMIFPPHTEGRSRLRSCDPARCITPPQAPAESFIFQRNSNDFIYSIRRANLGSDPATPRGASAPQDPQNLALSKGISMHHDLTTTITTPHHASPRPHHACGEAW